MELIKPGININFVGKRKQAFLLSGLLILITLVSLILHGGPNYGIDFAGGILVQVKFDKATDAPAIKKALTPIGLNDSLVQPFDENGQEYLIRAEKAGLKLDGLSKNISDTLKASYSEGFEVRRVEMVGPKVGADLRQKALLAIFYAIVMIAVYISGRFEGKWTLAIIMAIVLVGATLLVNSFMGDSGGVVYLIITAIVVTVAACWVLRLRYAIGAIVALIHDVIITVGVLSVLDKEFTLPIVAALLTIIGYSLNDTIVVFDRIRENLNKAGKSPVLAKIVNESISQTLSRTILTSGTTLLVLICLYALGGGVIEDFALALLVGVVVGTYSSVFVASPMFMLLPEGKPGLAFLAPPEKEKPAPQNAKPESEAKAAPKAQKASKAATAKKRGKKPKRRR